MTLIKNYLKELCNLARRAGKGRIDTGIQRIALVQRAIPDHELAELVLTQSDGFKIRFRPNLTVSNERKVVIRRQPEPAPNSGLSRQ